MTKDPWMVKIIKYLYTEGSSHTAEISRNVHIATTTANKYLMKLLDDGIVVVTRYGVGRPVYWALKSTKPIRKIIDKI